jgi:hypothetical protein
MPWRAKKRIARRRKPIAVAAFSSARTSASATGFHSALGQIRDKLAGSEAVRELVLAVVRELVGR